MLRSPRQNLTVSLGEKIRRAGIPIAPLSPLGWSAKPAPQKSWHWPLLTLGPVVLVIGAVVLYMATGRYVTEEDAYVKAVNVSMFPMLAATGVVFLTQPH